MSEPNRTADREQREKAQLRAPLVERLASSETVLIAGGLVLFIVLLLEMHLPAEDGDFLNPPLIAAAATILLWPLRKHFAVRALMFSGGFLLGLWFLDKLSEVLIPFVFVYLLAFLFDPVVASLQRRYDIPRGVSSLGVTVLVVGLFALFVLQIVPNLIAELETLASRLLASVGHLREWLTTTTMLDELEAIGIIQDRQQLVGDVTVALQEQAASITGSIPRTTQRVIRYIGSLLGFVTLLAIVPVILYYTLKDYPFIKQRLVELFPTVDGQRDYLVEVGGVMGGYLRGQLTISAIAAFNVSVLLLIFNVPFALLIGLTAGVLNMIPTLGAIITNIIGVTLAVIFGDPWLLKALTVFLVLAGQSLLEQSVLTPKILSSHVGLHPVLIVLSLFVFGYFLGIFGFLIAVPATALIMAVYKSYRKELQLELARSSARPSLAARLRRRLIRRAVPWGDWDEPSPPPEQPTPERPQGAPANQVGDGAAGGAEEHAAPVSDPPESQRDDR